MTYRTILPLALALALAAPAAALADEVSGSIHTGLDTGLSGVVDAAPSAAPGAGTYTSAQSVTLSASGADSIRYTTDDSEPTCTTGTLYALAINVSASETIRAVACYGGAASAVGIFAYGINLPNPPPSGGGGGGGGGGSGGGGTSGGGSIAPPPSSPLVGDINLDGVVDILDFTDLMAAWGQTGSSLPADVNHDGVVDILDFTLLLANWTA